MSGTPRGNDVNQHLQDKLDKLAERAADVLTKSLGAADQQPSIEKVERALNILSLYSSIKGHLT